MSPRVVRPRGPVQIVSQGPVDEVSVPLVRETKQDETYYCALCNNHQTDNNGVTNCKLGHRGAQSIVLMAIQGEPGQAVSYEPSKPFDRFVQPAAVIHPLIAVESQLAKIASLPPGAFSPPAVTRKPPIIPMAWGAERQALGLAPVPPIEIPSETTPAAPLAAPPARRVPPPLPAARAAMDEQRAEQIASGVEGCGTGATKIPVCDRQGYVAYVRLCIALGEIRTVNACFSKATGLNQTMLLGVEEKLRDQVETMRGRLGLENSRGVVEWKLPFNEQYPESASGGRQGDYGSETTDGDGATAD